MQDVRKMISDILSIPEDQVDSFLSGKMDLYRSWGVEPATDEGKLLAMPSPSELIH